MRDIKKLIQEVLSNHKHDCGCGCNGKCKKAPMLNENLGAKITITENMKYHIDNKLPLTENTFRYGSKAFLDLWAEARYLYSRDAINLLGEDRRIVENTHLGEFALYEGQMVPLDMPIIEHENYKWDYQNILNLITDMFGKEGDSMDKSISYSDIGNIISKYKNKYHWGSEAENEIAQLLRDHGWNIMKMEESIKYQAIQEDIKIFGKIYESVNIENSYKVEDIESDDVSNSFLFTDKHGIKRKLQYFKGNSVKLLWFDPSTKKWSTEKIPSKYEDEKVMNTFGKILVKVILPKYGSFHFKALNSARYRLFRALIYNSLDTSKYDMDFNDDKMEIEVKTKSNLSEAEKKKTPALNKPHRGGAGGKKYFVYVRDPKTKRVKKISFGDSGGLREKINDPKARKAFSARHDCPNKKDKMKASYWSCHLPRYAKALGLKSNFSGYW
jgi:hypothetical protein